MRPADQRVHGDVRPRHGAQAAHLAEVAYAQLHDGGLGPGVYAKQCERHAQLVVEVALGAQGVELLGEHAGHHLLGRGFAGAADYTDNGAGKALAALAGEARHRRGDVGDDYNAAGNALGDAACKRAGSALGKRGRYVVVAVDALAWEGAEHCALRGLAAVYDGAGHARRGVAAVQGAAGNTGYVAHSQSSHVLSSSSARSIIFWQSCS